MKLVSHSLIDSVVGFLQLVFSLLLPCLIFSQLGQAVTMQKMLDWYVSSPPIHVCCQCKDVLHCQSIIIVRSLKTFGFNDKYF